MSQLRAIDGAFIVAYFVVVVAVGLAFSPRAGRSLSDYFIAGRGVPWWLAGAGMIATTFAADTPLVVCGLVARYGVAGNWLWWCMVMSGIFTVFFVVPRSVRPDRFDCGGMLWSEVSDGEQGNVAARGGAARAQRTRPTNRGSTATTARRACAGAPR
jgi:hypothetical protein